jgi:DNA modification methylase
LRFGAQMNAYPLSIKSGMFWHSDCMDVFPFIPDASVDMVITSPPYDNLRSYGGSLEWSFDIFKAMLGNWLE